MHRYLPSRHFYNLFYFLNFVILYSNLRKDEEKEKVGKDVDEALKENYESCEKAKAEKEAKEAIWRYMLCWADYIIRFYNHIYYH